MPTANAIKVTASLQVDNGVYQFPRIGNQQQLITQNNPGGGNPGKVSLTETPEVISLGDITTPGWAYFKNLSNGSHINIGPDKGSSTIEPFIQLKPGEGCTLRLHPSMTLMAGIDTVGGSGSGSGDSSADLLVHVMED